MRRVLIGLAVLLFLTGNAYAEMVSITGSKVNLRSGPGKKYQVKWELGKGFPLQVERSNKNWLKVIDFENDTGWVHRDLTSKKAFLIVKVNKNKKKKINIRSGPGTKYRIVGQAYYGVVFKTLERGKGWVKVQHESGLKGWIKRNLLWGW